MSSSDAGVTSAPVPVPVPGMRVLIRDAEWVVRRVDMTSGREYQLVRDGVSELVREQEAVYLSSLEELEELDPARTRLTPDRSPGLAGSLLYMESQLRWTGIQESMSTEREPWLKVICALAGACGRSERDATNPPNGRMA